MQFKRKVSSCPGSRSLAKTLGIFSTSRLIGPLSTPRIFVDVIFMTFLRGEEVEFTFWSCDLTYRGWLDSHAIWLRFTIRRRKAISKTVCCKVSEEVCYSTGSPARYMDSFVNTCHRCP